MYRPKHYDETREGALFDFVEERAFGLLVSGAGGRLEATHVPFLLDRPGRLLRGHLARGNRQWRGLETGAELLAVFSGADAYISPTWYSAEPDVPTWNYAAVHVRGRWRRIDEPAAVRRLLEETVAHFEGRRNSDWSLARLDEGLIESLQRGVVAFELAIETLEGAWKMSQDKCPADVAGVVSGLKSCPAEGAHPVAGLVAEANAARNSK